MPDLRQLSHVIALAEELHVRRAARRVHISHAALLKSIRGTEEKLGGPLFERRGRALELTPLGRLVVERGRAMLAEQEALRRHAAGYVSLDRGLVVVGAGPGAARRHLPGAVARLLSLHPGLDVRLVIKGWGELLPVLLDRKIEFFVADAEHLSGEKGLRVTPLQSQPVIWFSRCGHPLAGKRLVRPKDLVKHPLIGPQPPKRFLDSLDAALGPHLPPDRRPFQPSFVCEDYDVIRRTVAVSDCVSALPRSAVFDEIRAGLFCELRVKPGLPVSGEALVTLNEVAMQPAAALLERFILDAADPAGK
jgi:DNA-binding transcriptional LysR family regulator